MRRRDFLKHAGCAFVGAGVHSLLGLGSPVSAETFGKFDRAFQLDLASMALDLARRAGVGYADVRVGRDEQEFVFTREDRLEHLNSAYAVGFGVRVLVNGSWGFAASETPGEDEVKKVVALAIENAEANSLIQSTKIVLEDLPAYQQDWIMPVKIDPFTIPPAEKAAKLLSINAAALKAGANFAHRRCTPSARRDCSPPAAAAASRRCACAAIPWFEVTAIDGSRASSPAAASLAAPRGEGWEYVEGYDFLAEAALAASRRARSSRAKPVEPGKYDLVLDPTNLWLTIHEIGRPSDRTRPRPRLGGQLCRNIFRDAGQAAARSNSAAR